MGQPFVPGINTLLEEDLFCTRVSGDAVSKVPPRMEVAAENVEHEGDAYCTMTNDENQIDASPINVPEQTPPYIPTEVSNAAVAVHEKRSTWFPTCKMKQKKCGGSRRDR